MRIDGQTIAEEIIGRLKNFPTPQKILAAVLIDNNPSSASFLRQKEKAAKELGLDFRLYHFSADLGNDGLRDEIGRLAKQKSVGGIIIQLPLPRGINSSYVLNVLPREKDIDVLGERALGAFYNGRNPVLPPAVSTAKIIFEKTEFNLENAAVAVVGLGRLVGKPISIWLMRRCRDLFLLHKNSDFKILVGADVVITGVGKAEIIKAKMLKSGAGVIDFGYSVHGGRVVGDLDIGTRPDDQQLNFYTPTPGGTGPILVAKLLENFYSLAKSN